jgi:hypothetical protein
MYGFGLGEVGGDRKGSLGFWDGYFLLGRRGVLFLA